MVSTPRLRLPSALVALAAVLALVQAPAGAQDRPVRDPRARTAAPIALRARTAPERPGTTTTRSPSAATDRTTWGALAPVAGSSFEAIPRIGANWPGDPTGAVSDTWFLTAVNTSYALYDLTGATVIQPTSFQGLFNLAAGTQVFDPKVVYDPYGDAFVLAFLGVNDALQKSWILVVAMPDQTASDTSTWCGTRIVADRTRGDGRQWADYTGLGFSRDRVAISTNQFDFAGSRFSSAQILSFPKANLYDCSRQVRFSTFVGADTLSPSGSPAFTIVPAVSAGEGPRSQYLVSLDDTMKPAALVVWRIADTAKGLALSRGALEIGGKVPIAPYGTQCDGSRTRSDTWWDPGDLRLVTAFYDADRGLLYTAHAMSKDLTPDPTPDRYVESVVRWYEIRLTAKLKGSEIARRGVIGEPGSDAGWPSLASDTAGNLFVTYSQASQPNGECLSAYAAEIPPGSTTPVTLLLSAGQSRFEAVRGPERWGDYTATVRDPVNGSRIVMVNQYAKADGVGTTIDWQQTVNVLADG